MDFIHQEWATGCRWRHACGKSGKLYGVVFGFRVWIFLTPSGCIVIIYMTYAMRRPPKLSPDAKTQALREAGALHPHPEAVRDDAFLSHPFFDPRDRVQVKYEMVRRHRVDGRPVTEVAARFGVSRQTFYQTAAAFEAHGIPGLVPKRPGPKHAHKCTDAVVDYVERWRAGEDVLPDEPLTAAVARRFGISIHARSLDRAVARRKKKTAPVDDATTLSGLDVDQACRQYEVARQDAATEVSFSRRGYGVALLMTRGMPAWLAAMSTLSLPSVGPPPAESGDLDLPPPSVRSEMARVLASLVLSRVAEGVFP